MALGEDTKTVIQKYGPYVRSLACTVRKQFNAQLELEELIAYGQMGLLEAAERFDPRVGAGFLTFAHYRIKGAIFDGLRKMGVLRGADLREAHLGGRVTAFLGNLADREAGGSNRGASVVDDVKEISSAVAGLAMVFATSMEATEGLQIADHSLLPADEKLELDQLKRRVRAAMEQLPEKERKLLLGYYFQSKTLEEAGAEIGQSKSWASRLHARAIERLKETLSEDEEESSSDSRRQADGATTGRNLGGPDRPAEAAGARHRSGQARPK